MNKNRIIKEYKEFLNEDILNLGDIKKLDNFLDITNKEKEILEGFYDIVKEIKNITYNIDDLKIKNEGIVDDNVNMIRYLITLPSNIKSVVDKVYKYYQDNKLSLSDKVLDIVHSKFFVTQKENDSFHLNHFIKEYNTILGNIIVEIEHDDYNHIHMKHGIPNYLKGLNLGENIYLAMCKHLNYISTKNPENYGDYTISFRAKGVWLKLVKNDKVYSSGIKNKILCIHSDVDIKIIVDILEHFFKDFINNKRYDYKYMIDPDLMPKLIEYANTNKDKDNNIKLKDLIEKSIKRD